MLKLQPPRPVLPRDTPFWLQLPADFGAHSGGDGSAGSAAAPTLVLALSCADGALRDVCRLEADGILERVLGDFDIEYVEDSDWTRFPAVGDALRRAARKEECLTAACDKGSGLWAFGVSMSTFNRQASARMAIVITLALQSQGLTLEDLSLYPGLSSMAATAHRGRPASRGSIITATTGWLAEVAWGARKVLEAWCCPWRARRWLAIASPCEGAPVHWARRRINASGSVAWEGFCVCCKRPLSMTFGEAPPAQKRRKAERYAYGCALWGTDPQNVLGAIVLGYSLRQTGTQHDMILLHTSDVPCGALTLLRRVGWRPYHVDYLMGTELLFSNPNNRFSGVFTKLRALALVEYSKVLLLDADMLVRDNIDHLFQLPAPAAMHRGMECGYRHGEKIDGRFFFSGARPGYDAHSAYWSSTDAWDSFASVQGPWSWGQATGINAGLMLLRPDMETLSQCLAEVTDGMHPEHIRTSGPEQDYLSRFYAGDWTHISVAYNFQIHQMYFMLGAYAMAGELTADRMRFVLKPDLIKVFHYSAYPKPWARHLDAEFSNLDDAQWLKHVLGGFSGYRQWVLRDPEYFPDGDSDSLPALPAWAPEAIERVAALALRHWDEAYREAAEELGEPKLAGAVLAAAAAQADEWSETPLAA